MTPLEALRFVAEKESALEKATAALSAQMADLKARMKLMMQGIHGLKKLQHRNDGDTDG